MYLFALSGAITLGLFVAPPRPLLTHTLYVANTVGATIEEFTPASVGTQFASIGNPFDLAFDAAGELYSANGGSNTIERFNLGGVGTVFASTSGEPDGLAFQVPEPSTWVRLVASGAGLLGLAFRRQRYV